MSADMIERRAVVRNILYQRIPLGVDADILRGVADEILVALGQFPDRRGDGELMRELRPSKETIEKITKAEWDNAAARLFARNAPLGSTGEVRRHGDGIIVDVGAAPTLEQHQRDTPGASGTARKAPSAASSGAASRTSGRAP